MRNTNSGETHADFDRSFELKTIKVPLWEIMS